MEIVVVFMLLVVVEQLKDVPLSLPLHCKPISTTWINLKQMIY